MKKFVCLSAVMALLLTGCNDITTIDPDVVYSTKNTESGSSSPDISSADTTAEPEDTTASGSLEDDTVPADKPMTEPDSTTSEPEESTSQPDENVPPVTTTKRPEETTTTIPPETDEPIEKSSEQLRLEQLVADNGRKISDYYTDDAEVVPLFFGDFDSDGTEELVALYGGTERYTDSSSYFYWGEVWFASENEVFRLDRNRTGEYFGFEMLNNADGVFLNFEDMYVTGSVTNWWAINNSCAEPVEIDGFAQMNLRYTEDGELIANHSTYDFSSDNTGHTWKIYWYYYSSEESKFIQYDAVDITEEQFLEYKGADEAMKMIKTDSIGYKPVRYLLFGNGNIAVNCISDETINDDGEQYYHKHFFIYSTDGGKLTDITGRYDEFNEGHYVTREDINRKMEEYNNAL